MNRTGPLEPSATKISRNPAERTEPTATSTTARNEVLNEPSSRSTADTMARTMTLKHTTKTTTSPATIKTAPESVQQLSGNYDGTPCTLSPRVSGNETPRGIETVVSYPVKNPSANVVGCPLPGEELQGTQTRIPVGTRVEYVNFTCPEGEWYERFQTPSLIILCLPSLEWSSTDIPPCTPENKRTMTTTKLSPTSPGNTVDLSPPNKGNGEFDSDRTIMPHLIIITTFEPV
ncbi:unnamed protein product [Cyprideis torosa]|uniref:Uncharacterized protein n=1 Tax=Cyprideis torosa TaxID=163714 RepID=A0A7R8ZIE2_9CRUS|nr:unnamed protein product [Cyprideis torosa]CAG0879751.1 unnamed protein product [Cyprideis torosa]